MRTSPASGTPPLMTSLSIGSLSLRPILGGQGLHGQRVNFLAHAIAERSVHNLMPLHAGFATKRFTYDQGFEVMTIADHFEMLTLQMVFYIAFDVFGSDHGHLLMLNEPAILAIAPSLVPKLVPGLEQPHAQSREQEQAGDDDTDAHLGSDIANAEEAVAKTVHHIEERVQMRGRLPERRQRFYGIEHPGEKRERHDDEVL